jgi:hypothetical protein
MKPALLVVLLACAAACGTPDRGRTTDASARAAAAPAGDWFTDRAQATGLRFTHFNGMAGEFYYPEVMPPGVALFDYDNDGDLDLFVVQGQMLGGKTLAQALVQPASPLTGRLFRNNLETGTLSFTDVTDQSGIAQRGYGMGVATGDYNNDGCVDLYVTALGDTTLYRNNCDGTFTDVTRASGTADRGWSVPATFFDYDRDGWLDLYVGHYVRYSVEKNVRCYSVTGIPDYCPPHIYRPEPSHLFHNNGNGTFTDVTARAGLSSAFGPALGVSAADFNGDGWIDLHVSNDSTPNLLWINQKNGTFKDTALLAGTAVSPQGQAKASMGVDAGDFDNDGDEDLVIAELTGQGADLYVNDGTGVFSDESAQAGLRLATLPFTGFGASWFDFDNDGWLDVGTVSGAVTHTVEALARNEKFALQQRKQLFRNLGNGHFDDVSTKAGAAFQTAYVSRGAAFGDIDNDGDTDIVVANDSGPLQLLINNIGNRKHWIGLRLVGPVARDGRGANPSRSPGESERLATRSAHGQIPVRDMTGARVEVMRADGRTLWRRSRADGSYASAQDPRVLAGLGDDASAPRVRVRWPDGRTEEWTTVAVDRYTTLQQGSGTPVGGAGTR